MKRSNFCNNLLVWKEINLDFTTLWKTFAARRNMEEIVDMKLSDADRVRLTR